MAINTTSQRKRDTSKPEKKSLSLSDILEIDLFQSKPGLKERMYFTERLALMLEAGNPLHGSLGTIRKTMSNPFMSKLISNVEDSIDRGGSFALALSQSRELFDATYINLVAAGEKAGFLPDVLNQLHQSDKNRLELQAKIVAATFYPFFLLLFSIFVVLFVLLVLFPKFSSLFESLGDQLPVSTRILMGLSNFILQHWMYIVFSALVLGLLLYRYAKSPDFKRRLDTLKLRLPVIKDIVIEYYLLQTLRVIALSVKNGVNVLEAIKGCREIIQNKGFQHFLDETAELVESGEGISEGFRRSELVPDLVKQMIATGEESGHLAKVMHRVADHYEEELSKRLHKVSKLAEPLMLLLMGGFVGVLVSSLILPIFQLSRAVH